MSQICPQCQAPSPDVARFCKACGATLAATQAQGQTVVSATLAAGTQVLRDQIKTVVQRAQATFGTGPLPLPSPQMARAQPSQREHVVSTIDVSGSMGDPYDGSMIKLQAAIRANTSLLLQKAQIDPYDEMALVTFRSSAEKILDLCPILSNRQQIIQALQSLIPDNGTDIDEGLKVARATFDWNRRDVVRRIVLLTDGQGGEPLHTAEDLKSRGVVIDVIGVGPTPSEVNEELLRQVASVIEGQCRYRFIRDQKTLVQHYTWLANKTATA